MSVCGVITYFMKPFRQMPEWVVVHSSLWLPGVLLPLNVDDCLDDDDHKIRVQYYVCKCLDAKCLLKYRDNDAYSYPQRSGTKQVCSSIASRTTNENDKNMTILPRNICILLLVFCVFCEFIKQIMKNEKTWKQSLLIPFKRAFLKIF